MFRGVNDKRRRPLAKAKKKNKKTEETVFQKRKNKGEGEREKLIDTRDYSRSHATGNSCSRTSVSRESSCGTDSTSVRRRKNHETCTSFHHLLHLSPAPTTERRSRDLSPPALAEMHSRPSSPTPFLTPRRPFHARSENAAKFSPVSFPVRHSSHVPLRLV